MKTIWHIYLIYGIYIIYGVCIVCKHSDAKPVHKRFSSSICNIGGGYLMGISLNKIKFNESAIITCTSCNYYTSVNIQRLYSLNSYIINKTDQTQNSIQKIGNVYHYQFNYTSLSNTDGYVQCINEYSMSMPVLIETSIDKQLKLRAWRKSYPNYSFPNRSDQYEFILYIEHRFYTIHYIQYGLVSNNFYMYSPLVDSTNSTFKRILTININYNLYTFYIRMYIFDVPKTYQHIDPIDTYVGFANVLDYDEYEVKYLTREAKHIEL